MPPFSNKKKKQQLQQKRQMKRERVDDPNSFYRTIMQKTHFRGKPIGAQNQPNKSGANSIKDSGRDRFADLQFFRDTDEEVKERKEESYLPIIPLDEKQLEVDIDTPLASLDMPKRPPWDKTLTKDQLDRNERAYFKQFVDKLLEDASAEDKKLAYFDLNLDTWRQLWRVVEMSEIITIIVDIRHPMFHFPPPLYNYIVKDQKKIVIMVLNKIDLVAPSIVIAWQNYLQNLYPEVNIVPFASYAGMKTKTNGKRVGLMRMAADGAKRFQLLVERLVGSKNIDFTDWKEKIIEDGARRNEIVQEDSQSDDSDSDAESSKNITRKDCKQNVSSDDDQDECEFGSEALKKAHQINEKNDTTYYEGEKFKDGLLTIGCVGHPNVGKSSFMNALIGKKVVSVSRTPGHTKHFQTIFLTKNIRLCDCPGLVFPSYYPKQLQVLMGCYPISQLREPYSSIRYLAERVDVVNKLNLRPADEVAHQKPSVQLEEKSLKKDSWSAFSICESWAVTRGFITAKAGRPDVYRAANHMLRMALDGRTLCMKVLPANFLAERESHWEQHEDIEKIKRIQGIQNIINEDYDA